MLNSHFSSSLLAEIAGA